MVASGEVPIYSQQLADELMCEHAGAVWNERVSLLENRQKGRERKVDEAVSETLEAVKGASVGAWNLGVVYLALLVLMIFDPGNAALEVALATRG